MLRAEKRYTFKDGYQYVCLGQTPDERRTAERAHGRLVCLERWNENKKVWENMQNGKNGRG